MNRQRSEAALAASIVSLLFFLAAFIVFVFAALTALGDGFIFGGKPEPNAVSDFGMFVVAPAIAAFGGALPARALGAGWPRSLLVSGAAIAVLVYLYVGERTTLLTVAAVASPALVALVGAGGTITDNGLRAVLAVWTAFLFAAFLVPELLGNDDVVSNLTVVVLPEWLVLPTVTGLYRQVE